MASIKANPAVMREKATSLNGISQTIQGLTEEFSQEMENLKGQWDGKAAENTVTQFHGLKDNFQNIYDTIQQYSKFLEEAAKAQEETETNIANAASNQPS